MTYRALGPATLEITRAVRDVCDPRTPWLVGCSGGPDSLALTVAAHEAARRAGTSARAVIVDHGLQSGSAAIAEAVRDQLDRRGIAAEVVRVQVGGAGGPEAAAREARYTALRQAAAADAAEILVGHTLDDQAESVLLGLARGAGARSLAGMAVRRDGMVRPLLEVRRAVTEQACGELGLTPWVDPHNHCDRFARSRVRRHGLPALEADLGPGVVEALARTARLLRDDADLLDSLAEQAMECAAPELDCEVLAAQPPALRRRILLAWLKHRGGTDLREVHVSAVDALVMQWRGQGPIDVPGLRVTRVAGRLGITS